MRSSLLTFVLMLSWQVAHAQAPALQPQPQQKKSPALALTLEALCPIAGAGGFYAGETGRPAVLAVLSGLAGGVAAGSIFWLIHLDDQNPTGAGQVTSRLEQTTAISLLVVGGLTYLLARVSGLALASEATAAFNADRQPSPSGAP